MDLDPNKIVTQEETGEAAPIDQVEDRVESTMKKLEGEAKQHVADGLHNPQLKEEGKRLAEEAEGELGKM